MPTTPVSQAPYPASGDSDNVPADLQALAVWASTRIGMRFSDAAARDAALTSPVAGMLAWLDSPGALTLRTASVWRTVWAPMAWADIDLSSGLETYGSSDPQASPDGGNFVALRGAVQPAASGAQIDTGDVIGTIPGGVGTPLGGNFPVATQYLAGAAARVAISSGRQITYYGPSTGWVSLDGVRCPLAVLVG